MKNKNIFILLLAFATNVFGMEPELKQRQLNNSSRDMIESHTMEASKISSYEESACNRFCLYCRRDLNIAENIYHFIGCASLVAYICMVVDTFSDS
jgi:hypothetical protein